LKPCSEKIFIPFLQEHFPDLVPLYKTRYADRAFLPAEYKRRIATLVSRLCRLHGITVRDDETRHQASANLGILTRQLNLFGR
jgi:hypothetical protein